MDTLEFAVITGATGNLGREFARALAARKMNLILVARSRQRLNALALELQSVHSIRAEPVECDLADAQCVQQLPRQVYSFGARVSLLINNAGFGLRGEFFSLPLERQIEMIHLNVAAVSQLTYSLAREMVVARRGGIINVASAAGFQPIPFAAVYAATKAFVTSFSMALEQELRPHGVRIVTFCPGRIRNELYRGERQGNPRAERFSFACQGPGEIVQSALSALDRGGGLVVPGRLNKASLIIQRWIPRRLVPKLAARISRTREQKDLQRELNSMQKGDSEESGFGLRESARTH